MAKRKSGKQALAGLQREIARHRQTYNKLVATRDELAEELDGVEQELEQYRGVLGAFDAPARPTRKKRGRPAGSKNRTATTKKKTGTRKPRRGPAKGQARGNNTMTLQGAMSKTLHGKTLSVAEIADAVKKIGYKTKSNNFRTIVNQTLIKNPRDFKKVARGQYTAK